MFKVIGTKWAYKVNQPTYEFTCTEISDVSLLPNSQTRTEDYPNGIETGSTCICTADGSLYMLGADDLWHKL